MWDWHLLELLHLAQEEGYTEGQGWPSSSPLLLKVWQLPSWKAALLDSLNTLDGARAGNQAQLWQEKPGLSAWAGDSKGRA